MAKTNNRIVFIKRNPKDQNAFPEYMLEKGIIGVSRIRVIISYITGLIKLKLTELVFFAKLYRKSVALHFFLAIYM